MLNEDHKYTAFIHSRHSTTGPYYALTASRNNNV